jgi:hypothetical protein
MVVLVCAEVGTVLSIRDRQADTVLGHFAAAGDVCAECRKSSYSDFRHATADEILALGFQPGDYQ